MSGSSLTPTTSPLAGLTTWPKIVSHSRVTSYVPPSTAGTTFSPVTSPPYAESLLLQFERLANIYFLIIAILQSISIISPLGPLTAWAPLIVVLGISMLREGKAQIIQVTKIIRDIGRISNWTTSKRRECCGTVSCRKWNGMVWLLGIFAMLSRRTDFLLIWSCSALPLTMDEPS